MEEAPKDPLDISKEVVLVKDAQKDLSKVDVLVCGGCREVFHFVEELQAHKPKCTNVSVLRCENEEKSQIWGYTLWKTKQAHMLRSKGEEPPTSWEVYQRWTKLEQGEKDLWITAGKSLQFVHKTATGKMREDKKVEKDPLAIDDEISNEVSTNDLVKSGVLKTVTIVQESKRALRTTKDNEKEEYNVEKIMGKRFNPRKRYWEYEVKWENYIEPTWEPLPHLENCKALVQEFENKLKAEKELREKEKVPGRGRGRPRLNPQSPSAVKIVQKKPATASPAAVIITTPGGRPQRTSKQKALNQVKAWCGNMSDEEGGGMKRPYDDDVDSDDSFEKKMKLDGESEDTEEDEPKPPMRKVAKIVHTYNNGAAGRTPTRLPDNVLIPDAKGVVRISQKQLPSLSSGVYIMSKSSGIIKLDPAASKIATSGGQAIVKVSPKIGQTQIKIIKKEDGSKRVVQVKGPEVSTPTMIAPKPKVVQTPVSRSPVIKRDIEKLLKKAEVLKPPPLRTIEKKEEPKVAVATPAKQDDDSDDGIPDWEFPADVPVVPEPESPPGDFTLDPFTGKVAGMEYPDPEPEPVANKEEKKDETPTPSPNLENIVKLAAAEITEDDLKPDSDVSEPTTTATITQPEGTLTTSTPPSTVSEVTTTITTKTVATTSEAKATPSILSTAMANSNILQKTLQSPRPKTQPRIINQAVARPRTSVTPLIKSVRPSPSKHSIPPKPKFNIAPMNQAKPVTPKTNSVARKVNNTSTTVYKTKTVSQPSVVKKSPQKVAAAAPKPVISMPSLDEEPAAPTPVVLTPKVSETPAVEADLSTFTLATGDRPMFITGDDGTVYQVAGQNEEGQTILLTQDSDGQQQCLLVTSEALQEEMEQVGNPAQVLMEVQEPVEVAEEQPLVAQFIRTEPPSPGGTHKVVVMLPDGDVMVTQVTPEEYASLELDK